MTPLQIRDFFLAARKDLADYCDLLEKASESARQGLARCEAELAAIPETGAGPTERRTLLQRRDEMTAALEAMRPGLRTLQHQRDYPDTFAIKLPNVNPSTVENLSECCLQLAGPTGELATLTDKLRETFKYRLDEDTLFSRVSYFEALDPATKSDIWQRPDNGE